MEKIKILFISFFLCLFLCSCAGKETAENDAVNSEEIIMEEQQNSDENNQAVIAAGDADNIEIQKANEPNQGIEVSEDDSVSVDNEATTSNTDEEDEDNGFIPEPKKDVRGIYITGPTAGSERMQDLIALVENTSLNTVVIDIKNDEGNIVYNMDLQQVQDNEACIKYVRDMPSLLEELHSKDIYVIGRIVCFKDPILAEHEPELALCKPNGEPVTDAYGLAWVNPYKEGVRDYLCNIAIQAVKDGFDEIQFDYVRFPIGDDANAADYGVNMEEYPRYEGLTDFFSAVEAKLHSENVIFGADLFGTVITSETDKDRTGQDYVTIAGLCDDICPMIYPSHYYAGAFGFDIPDTHPYDVIFNALSDSQRVLSEGGLEEGTSSLVRPYLQCFTAVWVSGHLSYESKEVAEQIKAVYDAGYNQFILWNASNHYDQVEEALDMIEIE